MVSGYGGGCDNDAEIFECTNMEYAFVNWDLRTRNGQTYPFAFSIDDPEGTSESGSLYHSTIIFNVTYNNRSSISSTLTIINPRSLNGTKISCRGRTLMLIFPLISTRSKTLVSNCSRFRTCYILVSTEGLITRENTKNGISLMRKCA